MMRRLYRSRQERMLGGVCGGLGTYLGIDPTLIRIFFVLLVFGQGAGILIYLILWVLVPVEGTVPEGTMAENIHSGAEEIADRARTMGAELRRELTRPDSRWEVIVGVVLLVIGGLYLLQNLGLRWLQWWVLWPLLLVAAGVTLLVRGARGG
jgi:phage shock protein C